MTLQRELRQKGHSAKLHFDKLIAEDSMYTYDLFHDHVIRRNRRNRHSATNTDFPLQDDRFRQSGRTREGRNRGNVHYLATSEPRSTAQLEHRPRSPLDSSYHLLRPSDFPPLQPGRDASTSQLLLDPIDSRHTGLMSFQDSACPGNEQSLYVIPPA